MFTIWNLHHKEVGQHWISFGDLYASKREECLCDLPLEVDVPDWCSFQGSELSQMLLGIRGHISTDLYNHTHTQVGLLAKKGLSEGPLWACFQSGLHKQAQSKSMALGRRMEP